MSTFYVALVASSSIVAEIETSSYMVDFPFQTSSILESSKHLMPISSVTTAFLSMTIEVTENQATKLITGTSSIQSTKV